MTMLKRLRYVGFLSFLLLWVANLQAFCADARTAQALPYAEEIFKIINSLEYSGFPIIIKPQVALSLDFIKRRWTLHRIHQYDANGGIILEQGKYGLCAELSTYLYEQLKPILKEDYEMRFAMALEPGFFPTIESNHIILLMGNKRSNDSYLLDPSFHQYGRLSDFNEYRILGLQDTLSFVKDKSPDFSFQVDQSMPLFIRNDILLTFSVTAVDGHFDKDNFLFVISAYRRYQNDLEEVVMFGKVNGRVERLESKKVLGQLLSNEDISLLYTKLNAWVGQY